MTTTAIGTKAQAKRRGYDAEDAAYLALHGGLRSIFSAPTTVFTTDAVGLWGAFLGSIPRARRQHYNCRACQRFIERFGGLVEIGDAGEKRPALWRWAKAPAFFADSIQALDKRVSKARVTGVFLCDDPVWGLESNLSPKAEGGTWTHLHCKPPAVMIHKPSAVLSTSQAMAEKIQDHGTLSRGLAEFPLDVVKQAHTLLTSGALYRSEKCTGVAKWLLDLHVSREAHKSGRENLTWLAVALAPPGWCHVRSTIIGTLLEDIAAGKAFDAIKAAFDAKMSPLQYQRPQAAPSSGQIAAAEQVIAKLASAGALERRYARLDEVLAHAIWKPEPAPATAEAPMGGIFGHLKPDAKPTQVEVPPQTMTWDKFARTVLPDAERIEMLVPGGIASFFAFVTATNPDAPPILQWDGDDARNPVSWYLYASGSVAAAWSLQAFRWAEVEAITPQPSAWRQQTTHQGEGAYFILKGCRDATPKAAGLGLFPEILKSEYHGVRAVIEAHSSARELTGADAASACGLCMQKSATRGWGQVVRVSAKGSTLSYRIDRWD